MNIDRSSWGRIRVTGSDRIRFLQGLTTVNIETLADGAHAWGAILNPKGRVLSVIDVARLGEELLVACEPALTDKTLGLLQKYAVMDDVNFETITGAAHQTWTTSVDVWRAPIVEGGIGLEPETAPAAERLRIRAGFPRYGVDIDEDHFPFETPLAQFLDYKKGCYVGQEPVFRVHAQGNAARALRGLEIDGIVTPGAVIRHPAKDNAGTVTSVVDGGDGTMLALAYLHRTAWEIGGIVEIAGCRATVRELPW